jgi:2-keto-3-deoxy-galactonokinase
MHTRRQPRHLSGVLIGSELAYLAGAEHRDRRLLLAADAGLAPWYVRACEALAIDDRLTVVEAADAARLSALGQVAIWRRIQGV